MKYNIYQVDAFTDTLFSGNPAAVCITDYMAVIENESTLRGLQPDFVEISKLQARGLIVTLYLTE